ncbi:MAG: hypothetical protein JKX72_06140 [Robiginitomaculum sp.]|nr:hypothetical protein [Robiginitomaculum sp.]
MSILSLVKAINRIGGLDLHVSSKTRSYLFVAVLLLPIVFLLIITMQPWVDPKWMFLDTVTAAEYSDDCCHVYYGFVSNLGIFLWVATAAISLFCATVFLQWKNAKAILRFAVTAGLFSAWLAMDDAFLLHEIVFPKIGVPQFLVLAIYVLLALSYIISSWRVVLSSEYWILGLGVGGVAISLGVDQIYHSLDPMIVIIEDSAKFFGLFCWFAYHVVTLIVAFQTNMANQKPLQ